MSSQRSRNYKFKMGSSGTVAVGHQSGNSGMNLLGHPTHGITAAAFASSQSNNYNLGQANFCGLGAIGNLSNLNYLTKNSAAVNAKNSNMSAYATNASDLIRGFKSSQSIPVVTSQ